MRSQSETGRVYYSEIQYAALTARMVKRHPIFVTSPHSSEYY